MVCALLPLLILYILYSFEFLDNCGSSQGATSLTDSTNDKKQMEFNLETLQNKVQPFCRENKPDKINIILSWILCTNDKEEIRKFSTETPIKNIDTYLEKNEKDGWHLRLLKIDISLIQNYISNTSLLVLQRFIMGHKKDSIICNKCTFKVSNQNTNFFECQKCLLDFHLVCRNPQSITCDGKKEYLICDKCFFHLI